MVYQLCFSIDCIIAILNRVSGWCHAVCILLFILAAVLGFIVKLPFWKIFLGDGGAYFLGHIPFGAQYC